MRIKVLIGHVLFLLTSGEVVGYYPPASGPPPGSNQRLQQGLSSSVVSSPEATPPSSANRRPSRWVKWTTEHLGGAASNSRKGTTTQNEIESHAAADRITLAGAVVNVLLTVFKLYAGVVSKSAAMISDAVHSASDLFSDFVTLVAIRSARKPADEDHPYGHGRFETVGAMIVGAMLVTAAWGLAGNAIASLKAPPAVSEASTGRKLAMLAAVVSIVSKEVLFRATFAVGRAVNSAALKANAFHHRSDAMSSIVALVGIAASAVPGLWFADALAGAAVACMLGNVGLRISMEAIAELTDTVDEVDLKAIQDKVLTIDGIREVSSCRGRLVGGSLVVDVDVVANKKDLSASACRQLAEKARLAIFNDPHLLAGDKVVKTATVNVVPDVKICPVVASMPSEADLTNLVTRTLAEKSHASSDSNIDNRSFVHRDTVVRYDTLQPNIDIFLEPTNAKHTVDNLHEMAADIRRDLTQSLGSCGRIDGVYWLSPPAKPPAPPSCES